MLSSLSLLLLLWLFSPSLWWMAQWKTACCLSELPLRLDEWHRVSLLLLRWQWWYVFQVLWWILLLGCYIRQLFLLQSVWTGVSARCSGILSLVDGWLVCCVSYVRGCCWQMWFRIGVRHCHIQLLLMFSNKTAVYSHQWSHSDTNTVIEALTNPTTFFRFPPPPWRLRANYRVSSGRLRFQLYRKGAYFHHLSVCFQITAKRCDIWLNLYQRSFFIRRHLSNAQGRLNRSTTFKRLTLIFLKFSFIRPDHSYGTHSDVAIND